MYRYSIDDSHLYEESWLYPLHSERVRKVIMEKVKSEYKPGSSGEHFNELNIYCNKLTEQNYVCCGL